MPVLDAIPTSDVDPFSDDFLRDPYPDYAALRDSGPAVWLTKYRAWAVARYDDARTVLTDWKRFSSSPNPGLEPLRPGMPLGGVLGTDPPDHDRLRSVLLEHLSPRALRKISATIENQANDHVAQLVARGSFDCVVDLARPFPLKVVADLVGLPTEGRENLLALADAAFNNLGPANERTLSGVSQTTAYFSEYLPTAMNRASIAPGSWGEAMYAAVDAGRITEEEALFEISGFIVAGMDTTIHSIGSGLWLLAEHPDAWDALRQDPALARNVFEEVVRYESPVTFFARGVTEDTHLGGVPMAKGDRVIVLFGAANRDPGHFPDADRFDVWRRAADHLAFGYGTHACGGQGLARIEVPAIFAAFARQVERLELIGPPERHLNNTVRGLESLRMTVRPAADRA